LTPVAAAVTLAAFSLRVFDDCADMDNPHALYLESGLGRATNAAAALSMVALQALLRTPFPVGNAPAAFDSYLQSFVQVCAGQDLELRGVPQSLEEYCAAVQAKTVAAYEFAAWVGARRVTANETLLARCAACGAHIGWMVQMLDDIEALWFADGPNDLEIGRLTFPLLFGLRLDHPAAAALAALSTEPPYDVPRICVLLDEMEVRRHLMSHALDHRDQALAALGLPLAPAGEAALKQWFDWMLRDGERLLGAVA
jgi:geranylgeranyl pyrophosphate synthase